MKSKERVFRSGESVAFTPEAAAVYKADGGVVVGPSEKVGANRFYKVRVGAAVDNLVTVRGVHLRPAEVGECEANVIGPEVIA